MNLVLTVAIAAAYRYPLSLLFDYSKPAFDGPTKSRMNAVYLPELRTVETLVERRLIAWQED